MNAHKNTDMKSAHPNYTRKLLTMHLHASIEPLNRVSVHTEYMKKNIYGSVLCTKYFQNNSAAANSFNRCMI